MAKEHHLLELELHGFRGFDHVHLQNLRDVNVIVGENNAGKTSLLEAIAMGAGQKTETLGAYQRFRFGGQNLHKESQKWLKKEGFDGESSIRVGNQKGESQRILDKFNPRVSHPSELQLKISSISSHVGVQHDLITNFGEAVRSRQGEDLIHKILQQLDKRISRVRVDPLPTGNIITLDIGLSESIPLSQAGQGIYRVVAILAKLVGEKPDICLIDEVENGLHHTVQKQVWEGIASVAKQLEIQLFVSTHSNECLEAAFEVFDATEEDDFAVIQCMRIGDRLESRVLGEAEIQAAFRNEVELR